MSADGILGSSSWMRKVRGLGGLAKRTLLEFALWLGVAGVFLEFLLRLMEVLFVSVDCPRALPLAPVFREESVQTVWRESFALRYSLSDVLVSPPLLLRRPSWPLSLIHI